MPVEVVLASMC